MESSLALAGLYPSIEKDYENIEGSQVKQKEPSLLFLVPFVFKVEG
jgi:hypothetical protein